MALDRQSIEKKDFPIGRRGYDPEAVDAHLSALATEIEGLNRSARHRSESLAAAASEQVRSIVDAAQSSASEIQRQAEDEAREIRTEASGEARSTREQATAQAGEYVGKVSESTAGMLQRIEAMQNELGALFESLRTGSNRLNADLQLLEGNLEEVRGAAVARPAFEPEPPSRREPIMSPGEEPTPQRVGSTPAAPSPGEAEPPPVAEGPVPTPEAPERRESAPLHSVPEPPVAPPTEPAPAGGAGNGADEAEGARLIALNMALNGTPREETDRYLAEHFQLTDRRRLLDEVYASVEG